MERGFARREKRRLRAHFESVLGALAARDTTRLPRRVRRRRERLIGALAGYRARGRFPRNVVSAAVTPIFVDPFETRCAMAHLVETSGARSLVDRVASRANLAYVRELADDLELRAWLDAHGLTAEEAARIQPSYEPTDPPFHHAFCQGTPAASVVRAHVHVVKAGQVSVDVDRVYGARTPTNALATRFAQIDDDDTLLVALGPAGAVVGRGWGAHGDKVEIDGFPTMSEGEAAALLMSPSCASDLAALKDRGEHPHEARASSTHGCACNMHASAPDGFLVVAAALITARVLRRRR